MATSLSIVIPAYNEEARIGATLEQLVNALASSRPFEVIVVDDGSRDQTGEIVAGFAARHSSIRLLRGRRNVGKGAAVRRGMLEATGEHVCFSDADLPVSVSEIERMTGLLEQGYDVVIASRTPEWTGVYVGRGTARRLISRGFNVMVRRIFGIPFRDTQCGVKCFRREVARDIFERSRIDGFAFDVEILLIASRLGLSLGQVSVSVTDTGLSSVRLAAHSTQVCRDVWRIYRNFRQGRYAVETDLQAFQKTDAGSIR